MAPLPSFTLALALTLALLPLSSTALRLTPLADGDGECGRAGETMPDAIPDVNPDVKPDVPPRAGDTAPDTDADSAGVGKAESGAEGDADVEVGVEVEADTETEVDGVWDEVDVDADAEVDGTDATDEGGGFRAEFELFKFGEALAFRDAVAAAGAGVGAESVAGPADAVAAAEGVFGVAVTAFVLLELAACIFGFGGVGAVFLVGLPLALVFCGGVGGWD